MLSSSGIVRDMLGETRWQRRLSRLQDLVFPQAEAMEPGLVYSRRGFGAERARVRVVRAKNERGCGAGGSGGDCSGRSPSLVAEEWPRVGVGVGAKAEGNGGATTAAGKHSKGMGRQRTPVQQGRRQAARA